MDSAPEDALSLEQLQLGDELVVIGPILNSTGPIVIGDTVYVEEVSDGKYLELLTGTGAGSKRAFIKPEEVSSTLRRV